MSEFIFGYNLFVVPFVVSYLLSFSSPAAIAKATHSGTPVTPRQLLVIRYRGLALAALFLFFSCIALALYDQRNEPPSFYSAFNLRCDSSTLEIKKQWKAAALLFHPDKSPTPEAQAEFMRLKAMAEILENPTTRKIYDRFGPETAVRASSASGAAAASASFEAQAYSLERIIFYLVWFALTYVFCLGRESQNGRSVAWILLALMAVVEYYMVTSIDGSFSPLSFLMPATPVYLKIKFLHALYPSLMHACRLYSQVTFVDFEMQQFQVMVEILRSNALILNTLNKVQASVEARAGMTAPTGEEVDDGSGLGSLPISARINNQRSKVEALQQQVANSQGSKFPTWMIPIGIMILANWMQKG